MQKLAMSCSDLFRRTIQNRHALSFDPPQFSVRHLAIL